MVTTIPVYSFIILLQGKALAFFADERLARFGEGIAGKSRFFKQILAHYAKIALLSAFIPYYPEHIAEQAAVEVGEGFVALHSEV
jgi:hypothetical protein